MRGSQVSQSAAAIHKYLEGVTPAVPRASRDELREMAVRLATVVNMHIGGASPLEPLTLEPTQVLQIQAQAAGLEFALANQADA